MSVLDEAAERAIDSGLQGIRSPAGYYCALLRLAGEKLAKVSDHDDAAAQHARLARRHAEMATRAKGRNRR